MKRMMITAAACACLAACAATQRAVPRTELAVGEGRGWHGTVRVGVVMRDGVLEEIRILDHRDDPWVGGAAMEELLDLALEYNTTDLDAVSGATESSEGFLEALRDAMRQAN